MAIPWIKSYRSKGLKEVIAIDLGIRTTKAVHLRTGGTGRCELLDYTLQAAPAHDKRIITPEILCDHLKAVINSLGSTCRDVVIAVGVENSIVRPLELPAFAPADLRQLVKVNSKTYFQQELADYTFDCYVAPAAGNLTASSEPIKGSDKAKTDRGKRRILVGGIREQILNDVRSAAETAGLTVHQVSPGQLGPVNAFLAMNPEPGSEVMALVDIAFLNSTVNIVFENELMLTRVVEFGSQRFTTGLAETMGISYPAAEGAILVLTEKVQQKLAPLLSPLGRDLRASVDFFEHEHSKTVTRVLISGGSARSDFIIQTLQNDLMLPCQKMTPLGPVALALPEQQTSEVERDAPQLVVAVGTGLAALDPRLIRINFLAEQQETEMLRRRDPVKHTVWAGACVILAALLWAGVLGVKRWRLQVEVDGFAAELAAVENKASAVLAAAREAGRTERVLAELDKVATNRFLWALPLNALQYAMVDNIQVTRLTIQQNIVRLAATKPVTNANRVLPGKPATTNEIITMAIQGKNFAGPAAREKFMETIARHPYFASHLRKTDPVLLKERSASQVDPIDPTKSFVLFTIECVFAEKPIHDE